MKSSSRHTYEAIVFDVGDTLLVRDPRDHEVLATRCESMGLSISRTAARYAWKQAELWMSEQLLRETYGAPKIPDQKLYRYLDFVALRTLSTKGSDEEIWYLTERLQTVPYQRQVWLLAVGVHKTLTKLRENEIKLGIASNFGETLFGLCDEFGLTPYFDVIVPSSRAGVEKPDPEILLATCRLLHVSPAKSLYVGDHPLDVICAKKAGMSMAWLCEPMDALPQGLEHEPDYLIHSITDILNIL